MRRLSSLAFAMPDRHLTGSAFARASVSFSRARAAVARPDGDIGGAEDGGAVDAGDA
jgi:hypothetical protein